MARLYDRELSPGGGIATPDYATLVRQPNPFASPLPPVATAVTELDGESFYANWEFVPGAASYLLDVSELANFGSFVTGFEAHSVSALTHFVDGLTLGTNYYVRVRAVNAYGVSFNSNTITTTTLDALIIHDSADTEIQDSTGTTIQETPA
jgi:hypothetical protein